MNIKKITYERNRNLGNYQSEKCFLEAEIDCDYDDVLSSLDELKEIADRCLFPEKYLEPERPEDKAELDLIFGMSDKEVNKRINEYVEPEDEDLPW